MKIKRVRPTDTRLADLQALCLPGDVPRDPSRDTCWLVLDGAQAVAFAMSSPTTHDPQMHYLSRAGVLPSHRGRGLQKRLIRLRLAHARACGAHTVVTDCTPENIASANSLMACGFRLYEPASRWAFARSLYWRCKL